MSRPFFPRNSSPSGPFVRVNGKIRARELRVIGPDGKQLGILTLGDALTQARASGLDLVEIAPNATPPVCRMMDYGKFRYEQAKREKESRKHQHATKVKEVQLSPKIDPHDLSVKLEHAIGFLREDMKVKVTLKFRGREMAHTEFGFQVVQAFLADLTAYGHPDYEPKLLGRGINVMITPLPRSKRAKAPPQTEAGAARAISLPRVENNGQGISVQAERAPARQPEEPRSSGFVNNPFAELEIHH
ncbi:MAG: translation initiation factor IF-3 [Limisphaerales bacterium]